MKKQNGIDCMQKEIEKTKVNGVVPNEGMQYRIRSRLEGSIIVGPNFRPIKPSLPIVDHVGNIMRRFRVKNEMLVVPDKRVMQRRPIKEEGSQH
jgi:hypothetical protein